MASPLSLSPSTLSLKFAPKLIFLYNTKFCPSSDSTKAVSLRNINALWQRSDLGLRIRPLVFTNSSNEATAERELNVEGEGEGEFGDEVDDDDEPPSLFPGLLEGEDEKELPPCPPGLCRYETMAIIRPDMSEEERLAFTQRYEELLVAGGGMYVEVFNRGVIPLSYSIRKKNKEGETNTYLDGIYLLFAYFTKPESLERLSETMRSDDDVIRSVNFKVRKRKY